MIEHRNTDARGYIKKRIAWLEDKEKHMRNPRSSDYSPSPVLQGRVQGQINELKFLLNLLWPSNTTLAEGSTRLEKKKESNDDWNDWDNGGGFDVAGK